MTLDIALISMVGASAVAVIGASVAVAKQAFTFGQFTKGTELRLEHLESRSGKTEAEVERHLQWHEDERTEAHAE